MANPLTGDFDAVVLVALRQLNALLATLHQNGLSSESGLKLLHSVRTRIGDVRRRPPDLGAFGDWVLEYQRARPAGPKPPVQNQLVNASPPGLAKRLEASFRDFDLVIDPSPPDVVRGTAALQISTVRLIIADGSTSEVTVHADIRALYEADPGTTPLPAPIHGEVRAVFEIRKVVAGAKTRLLIRPSPQDQKIEFIAAPGSGLTATDAGKIAVQVRKTLREGLTLLPVDLPSGFPFTDFKGLGSGEGGAIALPLQLSNAPPPPGGIQSITQSSIGASGFAFAVSRQHVQGLIDVEAIRDAIKQQTITFHVSVFGYGAQVTYHLRFTSGPTLTFQAGAIEISGSVAAETGTWWAPNGSVSFKQRITLVLDEAAQRVDLETMGEPNVDESWFIPHSRAVNVVKSQIAAALTANTPAVRRVFQDARTNLTTALRTFDQSASATYTQVEISPNGVIIRGELSSAPRIAPAVQFEPIDQGQALTALESWIPGGRIDRFTWSWVEYPSQLPTPWSGVAKSVTETARFTLPMPPDSGGISRICLQLAGERILPGGAHQSLVVGTVCEVSEPVLTVDAPSWWDPVMVPVWMPNLPQDVRLKDAIAAHLSVQTDLPRPWLASNVVVFFPDWQSVTPFDALAAALKKIRRPQMGIVVFVIVPMDAFDATRREFEARLAAFPVSIAGQVQVAADIERGWTRTFGVSATPALFLINARRQFVWSAAGNLDPAEIAAALDKHALPAPPPRFSPLRLRVSIGDRAPDVQFRDDGGEERALHRLRGQSVLITFWQSWSAPCLAVLRRLQALQKADKGGAPFIVAFHGGAARDTFDDIRREHGLSFPIVQDAEHRVARRFGVSCWPTTIAISPEGLIEHIQLGVEHDLGRTPDR